MLGNGLGGVLAAIVNGSGIALDELTGDADNGEAGALTGLLLDLNERFFASGDYCGDVCYGAGVHIAVLLLGASET